MDFNSNDFLGLTTKQTAQLQKMIQSGEAGTIVKKGANGAPVVDFSSGTLKETEGKKFDSNSFDFFADMVFRTLLKLVFEMFNRGVWLYV